MHEAEDRNQSWGRFPVVFEVTTDCIEMLVNKGFVNDTDDFLAFQKVARMRASMKAVCSGLDSIECDEEREAATYQVGEVLPRPMIDQHHSLQPVADRTGTDVVGELLSGIEVIDADEIARLDAEAEAEAARQAEATNQRHLEAQLSELEAQTRELHLCTCSTPQVGVYARHSDECAALSENERQRRSQRKQKAIEAKVAKLRNSKFVLTGGTTS